MIGIILWPICGYKYNIQYDYTSIQYYTYNLYRIWIGIIRLRYMYCIVVEE